MNTQDWMLEYAERGWYVFPVWGVVDGKCQCRSTKCKPGDIGKHPMTVHGKKDATISRETIINWCKKWPDCNVGVVAGTNSKLLIIDIDPRHGGDKSLEKLQEELGPLPETLIVKTGGGGKHFYFSYPKDRIIHDTTTKLGAGVDVRASVRGNEGFGGYVVMPPSNHKSGGVYEWENWQTGITTSTMPNAWLDKLEEAPVSVTWEEGVDVLEGQRHNYILYRAGKFRNEGYTGEELFLIVAIANEKYCKPVLPDDEVRRIVKDIAAKPINYFRNTDIGNGQRLAVRYNGQLKHCYEQKQWYAWDGARWAKDYGVVITRASKVVTEEMYKIAQRMTNKEYSDDAYKWAKNSQALARVNAMIEMAKTEGVIAVKSEDLDADPYLFNVRNGTIDLHTGELRKHNRKDLLTKLAAVDYVNVDKRSKEYKMWYGYLREVMGNEEQMKWVQLATGYTMTGLTIMEKAFFMYGSENTGKDTFITAITSVMGDYYEIIDPVIFYHRGSVRGGPTPELAKLPGVRMAAATEFKKGMRLSEDKFKRWTGGNEVTARSLYGHPFKYWPQFKIWLTMNDLPVTDAYGTGIWRRVVVIPFDYRPTVINFALKEIFKTSMEVRSVVLDWMVQGAVRWAQGERLEELAPSVAEATVAYKECQNPLKSWFEERYERCDNPPTVISFMTLYGHCEEHCRVHKLYIDHWGFKGPRSFSQQIKLLFPWLRKVGDTSQTKLNIRQRVQE